MQENKEQIETKDQVTVEPAKVDQASVENKVVDGTGNNTKKPYCIYNNVSISTRALSITILIGVLVVFGAIIIGILTK